MKKVLLIDGESIAAHDSWSHLDPDKYFTITVSSGYDGIIQAKEERPDAIFCTWTLPDMEANEVLSQLGSTGLLNFTPFVLISGKESFSMAMNTDADFVLPRENFPDELTWVIEKSINDKILHVDELNQIQHERNEQKLTPEGQEYPLEEVKKRLTVIQRLFPIIKLGRKSFETGTKILDEKTNEELDTTILSAVKFINYGNIKVTDVSEIPVKDIWLVDDDPTQNLLNRIVLKQINPKWNIREYNDAGRAFNALKVNKPDLVFLDVNMPNMSGFDFLRRLAADKINLNVVMLTSSSSPSTIRRSMDYEQVINYFVKPIRRDKLGSILAGCYL